MDNQSLSILFQAGPIESRDVVGLRLERGLCKVATAHVEVRSITYVEPDDLLGVPARIAFGHDKADHELHGVVMRVAMVASPDDEARDYLVYRLQVTSGLGLLAQQ